MHFTVNQMTGFHVAALAVDDESHSDLCSTSSRAQCSIDSEGPLIKFFSIETSQCHTHSQLVEINGS